MTWDQWKLQKACGFDCRKAEWDEIWEEYYSENILENKRMLDSGAILIQYYPLEMPECEDCHYGIERKPEHEEDDIPAIWCTHECLKHKVKRFVKDVPEDAMVGINTILWKISPRLLGRWLDFTYNIRHYRKR